MRKLRIAAVLAGVTAVLFVTAAVAYGQALPRPDTWVDGERFAGLVTSATFKPTSGNFDELYMCPGGFKDGVPLISDAGPGDTDYNGGRWHLNVITNPSDCGPSGKYANADSDADLTEADFTSTDTYFECPLLPRRGSN